MRRTSDALLPYMIFFPVLGDSMCPITTLAAHLELVTLPTDTAGQAGLLYQLLHLLQQRGLCHHLTLLIRLKGKHIERTLKQTTTRQEQAPKVTVLLAP